MARWVVLISALVVIASCNSDNGLTEDDLLGNWEVTYAERRGRTTEIVNGAWFHFHENGTLATNITGVIDSAAFHVDGMTFSHHGTEQAVYHIDEITPAEMIVRVELRNIPFKLTLTEIVE